MRQHNRVGNDALAPGVRRYRPVGPLMAESARVARSQLLVSGLIALVSCAIVLATLLTTGQTRTQQRNLLAVLDSAGTRTLRITDADGTAGIDISALDRILRMSPVESALALSAVRDVRNARIPGGALVPLRIVAGDMAGVDLPPDDGSTTGFVDRVSADQLGLTGASGAVNGTGTGTGTGTTQVSIGGVYTVDGSALDLRGMVLVRDPHWTTPVRTLVVRVRRGTPIQSVALAAMSLVGAQNPQALRLTIPAEVASLRARIDHQLTNSGRTTILATLAAGLALCALVVAAGTAARQRDFGRRRALGASRIQLVCLVMGQVTIAALLGALVGGLAGGVRLVASLHAAGAWFATAVTVLAVLAAACGSLGPAIVAATRDPLRTLRVP